MKTRCDHSFTTEAPIALMHDQGLALLRDLASSRKAFSSSDSGAHGEATKKGASL